MVETKSKIKLYIIFGLFLLISLLYWYFSDSYSLWTSMTNPWLVMVVSIILNPAYAFLIYLLWTQYEFRGIIAGLLISLGVDIVTLSHSIPFNAVLPTDLQATPLYSYSDTLIFKIISPYIQGTLASFILYVIIPLLLFFIALLVIGRVSSFDRIFKEAI